jgi:alpha-glucosidase
LSLYRALIRLRRDNDVLSIGDLRLLVANEHVLVYERRLGSRRVVVALHMTGQARSITFQRGAQEIFLSTYLDDSGRSNVDEIHLRADEGMVLRAMDIT